MWQSHLDHPGNKSDERFNMKGVKPVIDKIERELIADWFDLTDEQVEYLCNYHTEHGRKSL